MERKEEAEEAAVKRWRVAPRTLCKQADLTERQTAAKKKQKKDTKMSRSGWAACLLALLACLLAC